MSDLTIPGHTDETSNGKQQLIRSILLHRCELLEYSCAEVLYLIYKNEFMYKNGWYQYKNKWVCIKDCIEVRRKIPLLKVFIDEENKKFRSELTEIENNLRDTEEEDEKDDEHIKALNKSIEGIETKRTYLAHAKKQLDKTSFKNNIITECRDLFLDTIGLINVEHIHEDTEEWITPGTEKTIGMHTEKESPITLFVKHLITDKEYENEEVILLTSKELLIKFNQFIEKNKIVYKVNAISFGMLLKNSNINGIQTGINTRKCKKTQFVKIDIKNHMGL